MISGLRARLIRWHLAIMAAALVFFSILLHQSLSRSLYRHHDAELAVEASRLAASVRGFDFNSDLTRALGTGLSEELVLIRGADGRLLFRSPLLRTADPAIGAPEVKTNDDAGVQLPEFFTVSLDHSGPVRFISVPIGTPARAYLQLGRMLGDTPATLRTVAVACAVLIPVTLLVMSFGGWVVAGRAMEPMQTLDLELQTIQASDLSRRVAVPNDTDMRHLVTTVNGLLDRLERAFSALTQFTADVSHELQTPLTVMKATAERLLDPHLSTERERALATLAEGIDDMTRVLSDLRALALADAGAGGTQRSFVAIDDLVREAAEILEALAEPKQIAVTATIDAAATVWGNRTALKQVLLNLGDNAVKYTPGGGSVSIRLVTDGADAVVSVADTGAGIPPSALPHVFDRFFRVPGRIASTGTGLGLAIVKRIVEVHGGTVTADSRPGHGSTFTVRLPIRTP